MSRIDQNRVCELQGTDGATPFLLGGRSAWVVRAVSSFARKFGRLCPCLPFLVRLLSPFSVLSLSFIRFIIPSFLHSFIPFYYSLPFSIYLLSYSLTSITASFLLSRPQLS